MVGNALLEQPLAVRNLVYEDLASDKGNNFIARLSGSALSAVLSKETILNLYLANKREVAEQDGLLPRTGAFDKALVRGMGSAAETEATARRNADAKAVEMRNAGVPTELITAYIFREYHNAAVNRSAGQTLLGQIQFFGDHLTDPYNSTRNAALGIAGTIDRVLLDDKSALQHVRELKQGAVDFANADVRTQAIATGNAVGNGAALAIDAIAAKGASGVARRIGATADAVAGKAVVNGDAGALVGTSSAYQSATIVRGSTVQLTRDAVLTDGTLIPRGSVVTSVENGYIIVAPDGTPRTLVTQAQPGAQLALSGPVDLLTSNPSAHAFARHGGAVTDADLVTRARAG